MLGGTKLYVFDLDDTLIEGYMARPDKAFEPVAWLPGRLEKLGALRAAGAALAIVSNQAGVAFGYVTLAQVQRKMVRVAAEAEAAGAGFSAVYYCCAHPDSKHEQWGDPVEAARRKPSGAMILEAISVVRGDGHDTLMVGDRPEDEGAARDAGVLFAWAEDFFA